MYVFLLLGGAVLSVLIVVAYRDNLQSGIRAVDRLRRVFNSRHVDFGDHQSIEQWIHALELGAQLYRHKSHRLLTRSLQNAPPTDRPTLQCGAVLAAALHRRVDMWTIRQFVKRCVDEWRIDENAACHAIGWACAMRYPHSVHNVRVTLKELHGWRMFLCLDGYGFAFALQAAEDPSHGFKTMDRLDAVSRRVAYRGVGRFLSLYYWGDRRSFIAAVSRMPPEFDMDILEGAAFAVAHLNVDRPEVALRFARAMPYEWRDAVHAGIALGFHARWVQTPGHFESRLASLPGAQREAVQRAVQWVAQLERDYRAENEAPGYLVFRDHLARVLAREAVWNPIYVQAPEQTPSGGESAMR